MIYIPLHTERHTDTHTDRHTHPSLSREVLIQSSREDLDPRKLVSRGLWWVATLRLSEPPETWKEVLEPRGEVSSMWDCSSPRNHEKQPFPSCCG